MKSTNVARVISLYSFLSYIIYNLAPSIDLCKPMAILAHTGLLKNDLNYQIKITVKILLQRPGFISTISCRYK